MASKREKLDDLIDVARQRAWLQNPQAEIQFRTRHYERGDRHHDADRFSILKAHPQWPQMRLIARAYLHYCVFEPFETEAKFWELTCYANMMRFNFGSQETCVIAAGQDDVPYCGFMLRPGIVNEALRAGGAIPEYKFDKLRKYDDGGDDQLWYEPLPNQALQFLDAAPIIAAAKALTLDIARKKKTRYAKFHCFNLVDDVMAGLFDTTLATPSESLENVLLNTDDFVNAQASSADLAELQTQINTLGETDVTRLGIERVGQDIFRRRLMIEFNGCCPVTGIDDARLLRASHLKPWAKCESDIERLDVHNGLLLAAHIDAAFDAGLIGYNDEGELITSPQLSAKNFEALHVQLNYRLPSALLTSRRRRNLEWHRNKHGL